MGAMPLWINYKGTVYWLQMDYLRIECADADANDRVMQVFIYEITFVL